MKLIARQKIWLSIIIVANLLLWIIPSDVVENIARDRHTLLGRYSRGHFSAILGLFLFTVVSFYVDWSTGATYKRRWFAVIATLIMLAPSLLLVDFLLRSPQAEHYVRDSVAYHRPANFEHSERVLDEPPVARSYPQAPSGYPPIDCAMHMAGSPSQLELFDHKPVLKKHDAQPCPKEFLEGKRFAFIRPKSNPVMMGPVFDFRQHGQAGTWMSDLLPNLAGPLVIQATGTSQSDGTVDGGVLDSASANGTYIVQSKGDLDRKSVV